MVILPYLDWQNLIASIFYHKSKIPCINRKVLIFYDSFLLPCIQLYKNLFSDIYFVKSLFNNNINNKINPDLIFEFRIERFL